MKLYIKEKSSHMSYSTDLENYTESNNNQHQQNIT